MFGHWSVRRLTTGALVVSLLAALPFAAIAYWRGYQMRTHNALWAELAQAGRWLATSSVCSGASSSSLAKDDAQRWQDALRTLLNAQSYIHDRLLVQRLTVFDADLSAFDTAPDGPPVEWVRAHCDDLELLSSAALDAAVSLGMDRSSRGYRFEDRLLRDITAYLAVWLMLGLVLLIRVRTEVVKPAQRLSRVLRRIADGDLSAPLPTDEGGEMHELARVAQQATLAFAARDRLKVSRLQEMRETLKKVLESVSEPILIVDEATRVQYANAAACRLLDFELGQGEGPVLGHLGQGGILAHHTCELWKGGEAAVERDIALGPHIRRVHCTLVRDGAGEPSRVVIVVRSLDTPTR